MSISADTPQDFVLHLEIMCRAYELYGWRHEATNSADFKLQAELPSCGVCRSSDSETLHWGGGDTRAVRAARV